MGQYKVEQELIFQKKVHTLEEAYAQHKQEMIDIVLETVFRVPEYSVKEVVHAIKEYKQAEAEQREKQIKRRR